MSTITVEQRSALAQVYEILRAAAKRAAGTDASAGAANPGDAATEVRGDGARSST